MGLAYTIDSPVKVARYGISSVISIIEDKLVELMRRHYCQQANRPYHPISEREPDYRARRITDYLNLVNGIVRAQVETLRQSAFETKSEITKYFELLPRTNPVRQLYDKMMACRGIERQDLQRKLRRLITPGSIDVNVMTKVDKVNYDKARNPIPDGSDAVAALRGYIASDLTNSSIIFSAGLNPRLFNYLEQTTAFHPTGYGMFDKKVVIKVSDFRSALIQGKYLAKKAIWVSEFRIESGLNCGGHAFATDGALLGPILEEFKTRRQELTESMFKLYQEAAKTKQCLVFDEPHPIRISVQGGIGTFEEANFLHRYYGVASTGWGTPFLLCPEATTVDNDTLALLTKAQKQDVVLSRSSPLGVRFYYLKGTTAEKERDERIRKGRPGSPCTEKHLVSNTEFTDEPICTASRTYQERKIQQLKSMNLSPEEFAQRYDEVTEKECLCIGLINSAVHAYSLPPVKKLEAVTICPGPNIAYFDKVVSLREMVDHIYGRTNVLSTPHRPHMFIAELRLNIEYLQEKVDMLNGDGKGSQEIVAFGTQLLNGISYYRGIAAEITDGGGEPFQVELTDCEASVRKILSRFES